MPWLAGFVVLTIAGERLELARSGDGSTSRRPAAARWAPRGRAASSHPCCGRRSGYPLLGARAARPRGLAGPARRGPAHGARDRPGPVRGRRHAGRLRLAGRRRRRSGCWRRGARGAAYDAVVHAVFLGFTISMIMAHAPVILPAVLRRPLPYRPVMLAAARAAARRRCCCGCGSATHSASMPAWRIGGVLNVVALLSFVAVAVWSAARVPRATVTADRRPASRPAAASGRCATCPAVLWLVAARRGRAVHPVVPAPRWLMIHLLLLGAVTHAILVWSPHFTDDAAAHRSARRRRQQSVRLAPAQLGVLLVVGRGPGVASGRTVARRRRRGAAVVVARRSRSLASCAAHCRPGSRHGALLRRRGLHCCPSAPGSARCWRAASANLARPADARPRAGQRARLDGADRGRHPGDAVAHDAAHPARATAPSAPPARRCPSCSAGSCWSRLPGVPAGCRSSALGLAGYLGGLWLLGRPFVPGPGRGHPPPTRPGRSGRGWLARRQPGRRRRRDRHRVWWPRRATGSRRSPRRLAAGFGAQVLLGALSYLVPVVARRRAVRRPRGATPSMDRGGALRVTLVNAGLLVCLLPVPSLVRVLSSVAGARRPGRVPAAAVPRPARVTPQRGRRPAAAAVAAPTTRTAWADRRARGDRARRGRARAVAAGVALDPRRGRCRRADAATGSRPPATPPRSRSRPRTCGSAPRHIAVPAGDRLVIDLTNTDEATCTTWCSRPAPTAVGSPPASARSTSGWSAVTSTAGARWSGTGSWAWCSTSSVTGGDRCPGRARGPRTAEPRPRPAPASAAHGDAADDLDFMAAPGPGFEAHDAALPPLPAGRVHRRTFTVRDVETEVAPGVTQKLWTYNGTAPGRPCTDGSATGS